MSPPPQTYLALDFGNTRDKYAVFQGFTLMEAGAAGAAALADGGNPGSIPISHPGPESSATASPEPARHRFDPSSLGQIIARFQPTRVVLSNSGPERKVLLTWLHEQVPVLSLSHDTPLPFASAYETPETLGYDRIALAAGAWQRATGQPVLAIDAGTCITLDLVDAQGVYQGGVIAPGVRMRLDAMHTFTARLPLVQWNGLADEAPLLGKSTRGCLLAGAVTASAAELDGLLDRFRQENPGLLAFITGGDGPALEASMKNRIFAVPHLLMEGLNKILIYNVLERN